MVSDDFKTRRTFIIGNVVYEKNPQNREVVAEFYQQKTLT